MFGNSCSFGLPCVSFVNLVNFFYVGASLHFGFEGGRWDLIDSYPDHCLPFKLPTEE